MFTSHGAGHHQGEGAVARGGDGEGAQQARGEGGEGDHLTVQVEEIGSCKILSKKLLLRKNRFLSQL